MVTQVGGSSVGNGMEELRRAVATHDYGGEVLRATLCRTYGAPFLASGPALAGWANMWRAPGAGEKRRGPRI